VKIGYNSLCILDCINCYIGAVILFLSKAKIYPEIKEKMSKESLKLGGGGWW